MKNEGKYPLLFSAIKLGSVTLKNRLIHAAITTSFVNDGSLSETFCNYYLNRAIGGAGAIILEPSNMHSGQTDLRRPDIFNGRNTDELKRLVEQVEEQDCRFFAQIQDSGRGVRELGRNDAAIGASALPDDLSWTVPHALSYDQIQILVAEIAMSCRLVKDAGFSGVELSAGHGHLFHQFMSSWSNHREDQYGGDLTGRTLLIKQLIQAIRSETDNAFVIGMKMPAADGVPNSIGIGEAAAIAEVIAETNEVNYWTFCRGAHANSLFEHLPDAYGERTPYMQEIRTLRNTKPEIPTAALGYITDPNEAEHLLEDGSAELIMLGRPLITDPAWGLKAQQGREAEIRYCVSCNTCWRTVVNDNRLECDNNPRVAKIDEADWQPKQAQQIKNIAIVGAGVAGMEAAWVAGLRGHKVTVFGSGSEVGGKTRLHADLPGGENLSSIYDYQLLAANRGSVDMKLGFKVDVGMVTTDDPDIIILATGSSMQWPSFLPTEYRGEGFFPDLRELTVSFSQRSERQSGRLVIFDQDHTEMTYGAAEFFADIFDEVVLVTPRERIASDVSLTNRQGIYQRLYKKRVRIITSCMPCSDSDFEEGQLSITNIYNEQRIELDDIAVFTYSTPRKPNDQLLEPLQKLGFDVRLIGDSYAPRSVLAATREGHALGELI